MQNLEEPNGYIKELHGIEPRIIADKADLTFEANNYQVSKSSQRLIDSIESR